MWVVGTGVGLTSAPATAERAAEEWDHPLERSDDLAVVVIADLEGAIILARVRRDMTPFDALVNELGPLLDAVGRPIS